MAGIQDGITSKTISDFLDFLRGCSERHDIEYENVHMKEEESQDLLHKLELHPLSYHQEAHLALDLKRVRKERRAAKDIVSVYDPIKAYYEARGADIKALERLLGDVRKAEKLLNNRIYIPRVRKDEQNDS